MPASEIAKEMRPEAKQANGTKARSLRPSIRALAAAGGAYVIVSSKGSTLKGLTPRRDAMRAAVADLPGNDALHLDFYDRTRMAIGWATIRARCCGYRERIGQALPGWRPLGNWSGAPA